MQTLLNKNKTYTRYDLRSAYGTFLTAQSILYFNDEICKYYGAYNNITFTRGDDTISLVGVNYQGTTYTTTYDPTLGIIITNNATINETIQFRFMTTSMLAEWERHAIRLSLQNVTSSLDLLFEDMGLNNNNVIFTIDNETGIITIEPTTNQSYYIEIDLKTGITKVMIKTNEGELIKGAMSEVSQGYCYHGELSDLLTSALNSLTNFMLNDFKNFILDDVLNYDSDFFLHEAEDITGSTLITAGVLTASTGGGAPLGATMILAGVALCFSSTGGNLLSNDAFNPYYWVDAIPSIIGGLCPGGEVGVVVKSAVKIKFLGMPLTIGKKTRLKMGAEAAIPKSIPEYVKNKFSDYAKSSVLKFYLDEYGYSRGNYTK